MKTKELRVEQIASINDIFLRFKEEIARQLENSGARYVVTIGLFLQNIKQACEIYSGVEKIIVIGMDEIPGELFGFTPQK